GSAAHEAKNVIVATGAAARSLPSAKVDGKVVITSREALEVRTPPRRVVIIGAGPIGVEFGHAWASYGSEVTIVELLDTMVPLEDPDIGRLLKRSFEARGMTCLVKTKVESVEVTSKTAKVALSGETGSQTIEADLVLVAIGF